MSDRLADWVRAYDAQGWHRTATRTDAASARWLATEATALGADICMDRWALDRLVPGRCSLTVSDGRPIPGVPAFDCLPAPGGATVTGAIAELGADAPIGVCDLRDPDQREALPAARRSGRHRAIVALSFAGDDGLALVNAPEFARPFGVAVLQLAGRHRAAVRAAIGRRDRCSLTVDATRRPGHAVNVSAEPRRDTARHDGPELVVTTPRSGWWQCAAERGGGLACWLSALGAACGSAVPGPPPRFLATSGHELGHLGLEAALRDDPPPPGATWLHLGANLGALDGEIRCWASDPALGQTALRAFAREGCDLAVRSTPGGEAITLHRAGWRCLSLVGTNPRFHTRRDRYPAGVNLRTLSAVSRAVIHVLAEISA